MMGFIGLACLYFSGCVTTQTPQVLPPPLPTENFEALPDLSKGVTHQVKKGETLWRIAKTYEVAMEDIIKANKILKASQLEKDQALVIPGVTRVRDIVLETKVSQKEFAWPLKGHVVRYFRNRFKGRRNSGIDIKAKEGTQVKASRTGRVIFADYLTGYDNMIVLDHLDGYYSIYAHNAKLLVKLGDMVFKSNAIALVGLKGQEAYTHFEIRKQASAQNPLHFLP